MAKKTATDGMVDIVYQQVVESAANTLTFARIETGYGSLEKVAWIIQRIEWMYDTPGQLNSSGDYIAFGLSTTNSWTTFTIGEAAVKTWHRIQRIDMGAAASGIFFDNPVIDEWASLEGGGIIVLPYPLYLFAVGLGCGGANTIGARIYFRTIDLDGDQWMHLVQQTRLLS